MFSSPPEKSSSKIELHEVSEKNRDDSPPLNSNGVVFEEFLHYAAIQRRSEELSFRPDSSEPLEDKGNWFSRLSQQKGPNVNVDVRNASSITSLDEDEAERTNALRALRSASWASIFYLITTDILGPFNAPFAISQVGWVPGTSL
jgi:hypothetical protein